VAPTDLLRGGQERRRHSEHGGGPPAAAQAQRQPAPPEGPRDVQGETRFISNNNNNNIYSLVYSRLNVIDNVIFNIILYF